MVMRGIDLEQPSGEHHKEDSGPHVNVNNDAPGVHNSDGATVSKNSERDKENTGPNLSGCTSNSKHKVHAADGVAVNSHTNVEPNDGMEFESKEDAFSFYKEYAKSVGFAAIIKASRRSRITGNFIDAKFVCTRYGSKQESTTSETLAPVPNADRTASIPLKKKRGRMSRSWSKTDCKACMHVKRSQYGRWVVRTFIKEHNHEIFPDQAYYFRGHRNIDLGNSNVDALHAIRARTKRMFVTMSRQSGGPKKVRNQKSGISNSTQQHLRLDEGDAQAMLEYFMDMQDENPNFFYALDFNEEQRLRNIFWVDAKGRLDYGSFNDVVLFDTTYIKNEYKLPFAPFIGVNHHCQPLLLGCALIADETKSTYSWVMRAWLRAMGRQSPKVILTDQDKALKEAITEVLPDARHCFCMWHILSKIPEKLSYVLRQHENFMSKFNKCIFKSSTVEKYEKRWWKMVDIFNLRNDVWLQSLYEDREQWIPTYMKDILLAGMSPTERSESISSIFDKYMQRKTTLKEFLDQCKAILQDKCEEEAKADFETWHKQPGLKSPSPFGKQMATIYTHAIFKKFQVEVLGVVACHPKKESGDGANITFKVQDFEDNQDFIVVWNETTSFTSCSCRLFEYNGFLCRHVMIVLQMSGVHNIPSHYILKRWTKDAKSRQIRRQGSDMVESRVQRYNDICRQAFKLGDEGSLSQESYNIAFNALAEALKKCESVNNSIQNVLEPGSPSAHALHEFEDGNQGKIQRKTNNKSIIARKGQVQSEPEIITMGMHDSWQQMGHSNLQAPTLDCSYEMQESTQGTEQLNSRVPALDGFFGTQQIVQGMGQLNSMAPSRDDYFGNQHSMQGLGQLNSIAPIHDGHYLPQHRMHGLGHLQFRPQSIQSCFDIQDSLQHMDQSDPGSTQVRGMASKHFNTKHLSQ
ncbi:protein FAR-RED IMPAIRED RESPONSE 1-like [Actinidia eriantha]|uniref:protein FAR-RED IMPAIRED RESPONSE 1-like n=1 Tax=Actinidia eriantha TaxID=165200 RepID=UPI00258AB301|nr:protein FAR-RED IMPAIRED RESPONSE 1-like [Actinidia eriantha]